MALGLIRPSSAKTHVLPLHQQVRRLLRGDATDRAGAAAWPCSTALPGQLLGVPSQRQGPMAVSLCSPIFHCRTPLVAAQLDHCRKPRRQLLRDLGLWQLPQPAILALTDAQRQPLCGAFKVPSLRNVAHVAPSSITVCSMTLTTVVTFYAQRDTNPEKWQPHRSGRGGPRCHRGSQLPSRTCLRCTEAMSTPQRRLQPPAGWRARTDRKPRFAMWSPSWAP